MPPNTATRQTRIEREVGKTDSGSMKRMYWA
jgi:hypothetical protein